MSRQHKIKAKKGYQYAFIWHAGKGMLSPVQEYIKSGGNIDVKDETGKTALMAASFNDGHKHIVTYLIEHGAYVDARDKSGLTPAFYTRNLAILKYLIKRGAKINKKTSDGSTLIMSVSNNPINKDPMANLKIVKFLAENGVNPHEKDRQGKTAFDKAKNVHTKKYLLKLTRAHVIDKINYLSSAKQLSRVWASLPNANRTLPDDIVRRVSRFAVQRRSDSTETKKLRQMAKINRIPLTKQGKYKSNSTLKRELMNKEFHSKKKRK
jgi:hypothetical protein